MMKKIILSILSLSLLTTAANAATTTVNGTAEAEIINGITMEITTPLYFGTIIVGTTDGDIALDNTGTVTNVGSANHVFLGDATAGVVSFTGAPGLVLTLSISDGTEWVSGSDSLTGSVSFDNTTLTLGAANGKGTATLIAGLTIPADTATGTYTTTYVASADY